MMHFTQTKTPMVLPPKPAPKMLAPAKTFAQFAALENKALLRQQLGGGSEYSAPDKYAPAVRFARNKSTILAELASGPKPRLDLRLACGIGWLALKTACEALEAEGVIIKQVRRVSAGTRARECSYQLVTQ